MDKITQVKNLQDATPITATGTDMILTIRNGEILPVNALDMVGKTGIVSAENGIKGSLNASDQALPTTRPDNTPLQSGDAWDISVPSGSNITITGNGGPFTLNGTTGVFRYQQDGSWIYVANQNTGSDVPGPKGDTGQSTYELWLGLGNTGSVQDFINAISSGAYVDAPGYDLNLV